MNEYFPICRSCHRNLLKVRLESRLRFLERQRRRFHVSPNLSEAKRTTKTSTNDIKTYSSYNDSLPPSTLELSASSYFFQSHQPAKTWTGNEWRKDKPSTATADNGSALLVPEIVFLGRSNVGKSSLLNALLGSQDYCRVGPKPGKTQTMHSWTLAPLSQRSGARSNMKRDHKLTVLDMPGYGHGSRDEWGGDIIQYLKNRRQLRRAFLLLNPKHGLKDLDRQTLGLLKDLGISHQIIATKVETMKSVEISRQIAALRDVLSVEYSDDEARGSEQSSVSSMMLDDILAVGKLGDGKLNKKLSMEHFVGVDEVRWAVLRACGLEHYALNSYDEYLLRIGKSRASRRVSMLTDSLSMQTDATSIEESMTENLPAT